LLLVGDHPFCVAKDLLSRSISGEILLLLLSILSPIAITVFRKSARVDKANEGFYDLQPAQKKKGLLAFVFRSRAKMDAHEENPDFWQNHSLAYLEMAFRTDHRERVAQADGYAKKTGDCGDSIEFFVTVDHHTIRRLSYDVNGCLNTNACCNAVISLVEGRPLETAWEVTPECVADLLQTLPEDHFHCAELAVGALYLALSSARESRCSPWKKLHR
jgi:nitrogen fixation NifU-like protein